MTRLPLELQTRKHPCPYKTALMASVCILVVPLLLAIGIHQHGKEQSAREIQEQCRVTRDRVLNRPIATMPGIHEWYAKHCNNQGDTP